MGQFEARRTLVAFVLSLLLLAPASLRALGGPAEVRASRSQADQQPMPFNLEGKITDEAKGNLTVSTEGNIVFHVHYDDKTEIKKQDGSPGSATDLKVGVKVKVAGDLTESGVVNAHQIELE